MGLPRARGDGPPASEISRSVTRASPRSRGWTWRATHSPQPGCGFPALAGMDPAPGVQGLPRAGLPRARGDGPPNRRSSSEAGAASPRSRGWTRVAARAVPASEGFPALAGMDPASTCGRQTSARLPRARGDGPCPLTREDSKMRASPRSRGWTRAGGEDMTYTIGFPALAGMDLDMCETLSFGRRLPRARGDGPSPRAPPPDRRAASPRSRGWTWR